MMYFEMVDKAMMEQSNVDDQKFCGGNVLVARRYKCQLTTSSAKPTS